MLKVKNLVIKLREPILDDFSYTFNQGEIYGVVAANGSGKTTFFRSILGLIKFKSGKITYDNKSISKQKKDFFYFENSEWFDNNLSGKDYLTFVKEAWGSEKEIENVVYDWNMNDYIDISIKKYSLGMKQKLIISMYIISDAQCLIMDEVTNGLDENSRKKLYQTLEILAKKENKLIILSSHYADEIKDKCDYLLALSNGKMEEIEL